MKDYTKYDEKIMLYLFDELPAQEKIEFEDLLKKDSGLMNYLQLTKLLFNSIKSARKVSIDDVELDVARNKLFTNLKSESHKVKYNISILDLLKTFIFNNYKLAGAAISILSVGILIGYYFLLPERNISNDNETINIDKMVSRNSEYVLQDVSLNSTSSSDVTIILSGEKQIKLAANLNDPMIKHLIAKTLATSANDGIRLKTLNTIYNQTIQNNFILDRKIKTALIKTAMYDENPAVRKNALQVLGQYKYDEEIRDACLFALSNDKNAGNRIIAINMLAEITSRNNEIDKKLIEFLRSSKANDENKYVQNKSDIILRGIYQ